MQIIILISDPYLNEIGYLSYFYIVIYAFMIPLNVWASITVDTLFKGTEGEISQKVLFELLNDQGLRTYPYLPYLPYTEALLILETFLCIQNI